jgi:hypothetical protein
VPPGKMIVALRNELSALRAEREGRKDGNSP